MSLSSEALGAIHAALARMEGPCLGLAVSGGGDSRALAALAADWASGTGRRLAAVTVDHRLRPASRAEAEAAAAHCRAHGIPHRTLAWQGWDGQGNLQDAARRARQGLIADWARAAGITAVATGHTRDDQAETLLLRLARGSGVDGLAAMAPCRRIGGLFWHRPLLSVGRSELRDHLLDAGIGWTDDPSNDDARFDRVKARQALAALAPLGITAAGLAATAARLARARRALEEETLRLARAAARVDRGDVVLDWPAVAAASEEVRWRLVAHALGWVASAAYRPRARALAGTIAAMAAGRAATLQGCRITAEARVRRIAREHAAVRGTVCAVDKVWDGRWRLSGPGGPAREVRALGEAGLRACPDWRESGLPRASLAASPAIWAGDRLIAAPLAGFASGWRAELVRGADSFFDAMGPD